MPPWSMNKTGGSRGRGERRTGTWEAYQAICSFETNTSPYKRAVSSLQRDWEVVRTTQGKGVSGALVTAGNWESFALKQKACWSTAPSSPINGDLMFSIANNRFLEQPWNFSGKCFHNSHLVSHRSPNYTSSFLVSANQLLALDNNILFSATVSWQHQTPEGLHGAMTE